MTLSEKMQNALNELQDIMSNHLDEEVLEETFHFIDILQDGIDALEGIEDAVGAVREPKLKSEPKAKSDTTTKTSVEETF